MIKKRKHLAHKLMAGLLALGVFGIAQAGTPLWTFVPLTPTTLTVPANSSAIVQYQITNQSLQPYTLAMQPIPGITQLSTDFPQIIPSIGVCSARFVLRSKESCILSLLVNGAQLQRPIHFGPFVCQANFLSSCYQPSAANSLHIMPGSPITNAVISVSGSPLTLTANGSTGQLTVHNASTDVFATNIASNFTGTALDGLVTETGNTCNNVAPGTDCTLTYTPGGTSVPLTNFSIAGSNTNTLTAAIQIQQLSTLTSVSPTSGTASGGTGVTLTGTGLTGTTAVTFGGVAATSVNVVNSTTVTAVTPAHAAGIVDVAVTTPGGGATLTNGYTYVTTAVGQPASGGTIACLGGGLDNLIAATADNSSSIEWGATVTTNAQSTTDGSTNTATIVTVLGNNGGTPYAAQLCDNYAIDSLGNSPCQTGNTCYNDWFLPARDQLICLQTNQVAVGGFASTFYWSSTENSGAPTLLAELIQFPTLALVPATKTIAEAVRCVRAFTP
ncbi:MAG: IPT/TIG domain-containing protein [Tatlockia sp.]|jgi:hypothetical protein